MRHRAVGIWIGLALSGLCTGCALSHTLGADADSGSSDAGEMDGGSSDAGEPDPCTSALGVTCAAFEEAYLKASNTDQDDQFGREVALSGDTLVVGARAEDSAATGVNGDQGDNSASYAGAVYVFTRSNGVWSQQAYLKASNTEVSDAFGTDVAISGDTLVVGAPGEDSIATGVNGDQTDNTAQNSGAVYVFTRTAGVWSQQAYLKASNTHLNTTEDLGGFGSAVALSDNTLVVGAEGEASAATGVNGDQHNRAAEDSGAVYVFARTAGVWSQQAYLKASNTDAGDFFGTSVALSGDTIVVGATWEDSAATGVDGDQANNDSTSSGAAYVFTRNGSTWSQQAYLKPSNTDRGDWFGWFVAIDGDTLAVSARRESSAAVGLNGDDDDDTAFGAGAVYVFTRTANEWSQQAYVKASDTAAGDGFGLGLALSEDVLVVGAWEEDSDASGVDQVGVANGADGSGAVYVLSRTAESWSQLAYVKASNTDAGDFFGSFLALSGNTLAVGAWQEDGATTGVGGDQTSNAAEGSGAVYVRRIAP